MKRNLVVLFFLLLPYISICQGVDAGGDQNQCGNEFFMNAQLPVNSSGKWTIISVFPYVDQSEWNSVVVITDDENPQTKVIIETGLSVTLRWSIEDSGGMKYSDDVVLTNELFTVIPKMLCNDGKSVIELEIAGGSGNYKYKVNGGGWEIMPPDNKLENLVAGDYEITVFDGNCEFDVPKITVQSPLIATVSGSSVTLCFGQQYATIGLNIVGGLPNYEYRITDSDTWASLPSGNFIDLPVGKYAISVKDNNGCEVKTDSIEVTLSDELKINLESINHVSCFGGSDGSIRFEILSGNGGYEYSLDNGVSWIPLPSDSTIRNLLSGTYSVQIKDVTGCVPYISFTGIVINQPDELQVNLESVNHVLCFGGSDGSIRFEILSGNGGYEYSLDNGVSWIPLPSDSTIHNLLSGTYSVQIKDVTGCVPYISFTGIVINQPDELQVNLELINHVSCFGGSDGSIRFEILSGNGGYEYSLDNGFSWIPLPSDSTIRNLLSGTYSVQIKDVTDCAPYISFTGVVINQPDELRINLESVNDVSCFGGSDGSIRFEILSGNGGYEYSLDNGVSWIPLPSDSTIRNLLFGTYSVQIKDVTGCVPYINFTGIVINQPDELRINLESVNDVSCFGGSDGSIRFEILSGNGGYEYSLDNGVSWIAFPSDSTIRNLLSGTYSVQIKDVTGCVPYISFTGIVINQPDELQVNLESINHVSCFGGSDGSIRFEILSGNGGYEYSLDNGVSWIPLPSDSTIRNLLSDTYSVQIKDVTDCTPYISFTGIVINQSDELQVNLESINHVSCFGGSDGSIRFEILSGNGGYEYSLDNGFSWIPLPSDSTIHNLPSGTYSVQIKDVTDCTPYISFTGILINQPDELRINLESVNDVSCFGGSDGSIKLEILSGNGGYEYKLNNMNTWLPLSSDSVIGGLFAGSYELYIRDIEDCTPYNYFTNILINQPRELIVDVQSTLDASCHGISDGSVKLNIISGNGGYKYSIDGGISWLVLPADSLIQGLPVGTHDVYIKDQTDCSPYSFVSNITIGQPYELKVIADELRNTSCYGYSDGSVKLNIISGNGNYEYSIDNGITWNTIPTDSIIKNLSVGTYNIHVRDYYSCLPVIIIPITIESPVQLSYNYKVNQVLCNGENNGSIQIEASGGTGVYQYSIDSGQSYSIANLFNGLAIGNYTILVKDSNGCLSSMQDTIIAEPKPINIKMDITDNTCKASITIVETTGGYGEYLYSIDNGNSWSTLGVFTDLSGENYNITVKDKHNCQAVFPVILNMDYLRITPDVLPDYETNIPYNIQLQTSAVSPYTFVTNDRLPNGLELTTDGQIRGTPKAQIGYNGFNFMVKLTDKNGCEVDKPYVLKSDSDILIPEIITPNGDGKNDHFMKGYHVIIFDRLGMRLFEGDDGWDGTHKGKVVAQDTYFYILFYKGSKKAGSISVFK